MTDEPIEGPRRTPDSPRVARYGQLLLARIGAGIGEAGGSPPALAKSVES